MFIIFSVTKRGYNNGALYNTVKKSTSLNNNNLIDHMSNI